MILEEIKTKIINIINQYNIPFETKYFVLKDIYNDATNIYNELLENEKLAKEQQNNTKEEEIKEENKED